MPWCLMKFSYYFSFNCWVLFFFFNNERDKCSKMEIKAKILNSAVFSVKA